MKEGGLLVVFKPARFRLIARETEATAYTPYEKTYEIVYNEANGTYELSKIEPETEVENVSVALFDTNANLTFAQKAEIAYNTFREKYWEYTDSIEMNPNHPSNQTESFSDQAWNKFINSLLRSEAELTAGWL